MNRDELSRRSGLPAHQIRYLVSEGILPKAEATGRSADAYTEEHLRLAAEYVRLHAAGMRPKAIKEMFQGGVAARGGILSSGCVEVRVTDGDVLASMSDADVGDLAAALWRALVQARDEAREARHADDDDGEGRGDGGRSAEGVR